jgi:DNA-binding beta-propeller fold protein YncE
MTRKFWTRAHEQMGIRLEKLGPMLILAAAASVVAAGQSQPPLKLAQKFEMPAAVKGHFDHFEVDLRGNRLFSTAEDYKSVLVFDLHTGKLIHTITGIARPHAVLYRDDVHRIYVTDGGDGDLKVFDGKDYKLLKSIKLLPDADSIGYDPSTKYLYIDNGGGDAHQTYSLISIVDTNSDQKIGDIKVDGDTLEAMALEKSSPRMYVNNRAKNQIEVIDRAKRAIVESWPVTLGKFNVAIALDESAHRLFVACRSGQIVVFDTQAGKELQALAIAKGVDDAVFDARSRRIYAACGDGAGSVDVYKETDPDHFESLGQVASGPLGRTARLVPELNRYFVAVPAHEDSVAVVLVYQVQ